MFALKSVPGAIATGWYARRWRAIQETISVTEHASGVRTDPVAIAPGTDLSVKSSHCLHFQSIDFLAVAGILSGFISRMNTSPESCPNYPFNLRNTGIRNIRCCVAAWPVSTHLPKVARD